MIFIFMAIAMPVLGYNFKFVEDVEIGGWNVSAFFVRSCIALTLYTSAFVCEALRSGVNAVPLGQAEAGPGHRADLHPVDAAGRPAPGARAPSSRR